MTNNLTVDQGTVIEDNRDMENKLTLNQKEMQEAQRGLRIVQQNIDMFEGYKSSEHVDSTLKSLRSRKAELLAYAKGDLSRSELSYEAKMDMFIMPAWGYKGS